MDADGVNKAVRQALVSNGFTGVLPLQKAQSIVDQVTAHYAESQFRVTVEMSPIHTIGKPITVACDRSIIRVEPRHPSASKNR